MREQYRRDLRDLRADVVAIVHVIEDVTRGAVQSLVNGDVTLANEMIAREEDIDSMCLNIEETVFELMATQYPVARDLRLLMSLAYIASDLERMGDHAHSIAKATARTAYRRGPQTLYDLIKAQGNLVYRVLGSMRTSLDDLDIDEALGLDQLDEPVDHLYKQFFGELGRLTDEEDIEWASRMIMASRSLERISDYAVDIGERIVYLVTGDRDLSAEDVTEDN